MARDGDARRVVVIGAGVGGLTAGALLAARGLEVTVLERRDEPGGCCTSLVRDGYSFDIASSLFYGFGDRGFNANRRVLDELGVELELVRHDPGWAMVFEGSRVEFHEDLETHLAGLGRLFPSCEPGLRRFYAKARRIYDDTVRMGFLPLADASLLELTRVAFGNPSILTTYLPVLRRTVWRELAPLLPPPSSPEVTRLKALLDVDLAFGTCTPSELLPLLLAVPILYDRHVGGVSYPMGGAAAVPRALVRGLEAHGGTLRTGTPVRRILVEAGRARGVLLEDGTTVPADVVISNASVWDTYGRLLEPKDVSRARRRALARLAPSFSVFVTCVGVEAGVVPAGFHPHTVVVPDHRTGLDDASIVYVPSLDDPSLAPAGRHAVTLVNVARYELWGEDGPGSGRESPELEASHRARALALAEAFMPGIRARGEVVATLSPATLERSLGRPAGAVGGPAQTVDQSLDRRHGNRTDIDGLFLVGDSTFPGEGVVAVALSGLTCAGQILPRPSH